MINFKASIALNLVFLFYLLITMKFIVIFIIFSNITKCRLSCSDSSQCSWCGFCASDNTTKEPSCIFYPFEMFHKGKNTPSCFKEDECKSENPCKNGSKCRSGKYIFQSTSCICNKNKYYGEYCESLIPQELTNKLATGLEVFLSIEPKEHIYKVKVYVSAVYSGDELEIFVLSSEGFSVKTNQRHNCCRGIKLFPFKPNSECTMPDPCSQDLPDCSHVYLVEVDFPYKHDSQYHLFYKNKIVAGYRAKLDIIASNLQVNVFKQSFYSMINFNALGYDKGSMVPEIKISSCSRFEHSASVFYASDYIFWDAMFSHVKDDSMLDWGVWKIYSTTKPLITYISVIRSSTTWTISPYQLKNGKYKMRIKVTNILAAQITANFMECFFEIKYRDLIASLLGGSKRTVAKNEYFLISGYKSYNPNKPKGENSNLKFSWLCRPNCNNIINTNLGGMIMIDSSILTVGKTYIFTLFVSTPGMETASVSQEILVTDKNFGIQLNCILNCLKKVVPTDVLLLEAKSSINTRILASLSWAYSIDDGPKHKVDDLYNQKFPKHMLCVRQNVLLEGKTYKFEASYERLVTVYEIKVDMAPQNGSCYVNPTSGIVASTLFEITCSGYVHEDDVLVFEYYNKNKSGSVEKLKGILLGYNHDGTLRDVKLSRDLVVIVIYSLYGLPTQFSIEVNLHIKPDEQNVPFELQQINSLVTSENYEAAMNSISLLVDTLPYNSDNNLILQQLIHLIKFQPVKTMYYLKLGLLTLTNVLLKLNFSVGFTFMNLPTANYAIELTSLISAIYKTSVLESNIPYVTNEMLEELTTGLVEVIRTLFIHSPWSSAGNNVKPASIYYLEIMGEHYKEAFDSISFALAYRYNSFPATYIIKPNSSLYSLSVVSGDTSKTISIDGIAQLKSSMESVHGILINSIMKIPNILTVQITKIYFNPFSIDINNGQLTTELVSLNLFKISEQASMQMKKISSLPESVDLFLNVDKVYDPGTMFYSVKQLDSTLDESLLDVRLTIIRINLPARSKIFVEFTLGNIFDELRVLTLENLRPSYSDALKMSKVITASSPNYDVAFHNKNVDTFLYISILPGLNTAVGNSVNFTMKFFCNICLTRFQHSWNTDHCSVGGQTDRVKVHCICNHLSFFTAIFIVPPHEIDPFIEFKSFLTIKDNPFAVMYVSCVLLVFLIIAILTLISDHKRAGVRMVYYLDDNFPFETYEYIVAVFTGYRWMSGTSANVGLSIVGDCSRSRKHILKSGNQKLFTFNADNWFLIKSPEHLGTVNYIHIWHDNTGFSPSWDCEKILLYDMTTYTVYVFYVYEWIALGDKQYPEAILFPAGETDFRSLSRIFIENVVHGMTHCHLLAGVMTRQRDIKITKFDKSVIVVTIVMTASLIGLSFSKYTAIEGVDEPEFSPGTRTVLKATEVFILNAFCIAFFNFIYKKSYHFDITTGFKEFHLYKKPDLIQNQCSKYSIFSNKKCEKVMSPYEKFVQVCYKVNRPMTQIPVVLSDSTPIILRNIKTYSFSLLSSVIAVGTSSYFIILYGIKLGETQTKYWMTQIVVAMINHFVLLVPIKITLVAIVLASHFVELVPISNYQIKIKDSVDLKEESPHQTLNHLLELRKDKAYCPLNMETVEKMRQRERKLQSFQRTLEIFCLLVLYILLGIIFPYHLWGQEFHANNHLKDVVQKRDLNLNNEYLSYITNSTQFQDFLINDFIQECTFYRKTWYNFFKLNSLELHDVIPWTADFTSQLVGVPKLRQLRVLPDTCSIPVIMSQTWTQCIPAWNGKKEDKNVYGYRWTIASFQGVNKPNPWIYRPSSESGFPYVRSGRTTIPYPNGGYVADLGMSLQETSSALLSLFDGRWIDEYTRVVFVVVPIYNVNYDMYSLVVLVGEHLPIGLYVTNIVADSVRHVAFSILWNSLILTYTVYLVIKIVVVLHRDGIVAFITKEAPTKIIQVLLVVLGILALISSWKYVQSSTAYLQNGIEKSKIIDYLSQTIYHKKNWILFTICFSFVVLIKLFLYWHYGKMFKFTLSVLKDTYNNTIMIPICAIGICVFHWNVFNHLNLFIFAKSDCRKLWSITLESRQCLVTSPVGFLFYFSTKCLLILVLLSQITSFKNTKYKPER